MTDSTSLSPPTMTELLRARVRRGVDLAVLVGTSVGSIVGVIDLVQGTSQEPWIAVVVMIALAVCGGLGVLGRARWTPTAYILLIMVANVVYLASYGLWFGLGSVYVLAVALAFLFLSPRWSWVVAIGLVGTPLVLGILFELGVLAHRPALILEDANAWRRAASGSATALVGIAVILSYTVRQLVKERHNLERARLAQREQRLERARVEAEIAQARRVDSIAQLAAEVGADIGAALEIIKTRAQALARELGAQDAQDCLSDISEATTNAGATMRSLTVFAPGANLTARGNASHAVRALPKLVRRVLPARIALDTEAIDDDAWVGIATSDLGRICANLVLNARDAIADSGTISVRVTRDPSHVVLEVRDTGAGMSDDIIAKLFKPFFTTKAVGRGSGLGLATAKVLVEHAAGTIALTSAVGRGTVFSIRLPWLGPDLDHSQV